MLALALAGPARADHGGEYGRWPVSSIRVLDGIAPTLARKSERRAWRAVRAGVLDAYAGAGFAFGVEPAAPCEGTPEPPTGSILVCRARGFGAGCCYAAHRWSSPGVIEAVRILTPPFGVLFCHELGHALGLGHRADGKGCMASVGGLPDAHDLEALAA